MKTAQSLESPYELLLLSVLVIGSLGLFLNRSVACGNLPATYPMYLDLTLACVHIIFLMETLQRCSLVNIILFLRDNVCALL